MVNNRFKNSPVLRLIALAALFVFVIFIIASLTRDARLLMRSGGPRINKENIRALLEKQNARQPLPAQDIEYIKSWMTFDYINRVFQIPPEHFKIIFHISDPRYPKLVIRQAAKTLDISPEAFLAQVKNAIREYFNDKNQTP